MTTDGPTIDGLTVHEQIGAGGFSTVWRATDDALGREVAVKVLSTTARDATTAMRFERECKALGAVSGHPNIVTVHQVGTTSTGYPYLVLGYERGGSLGDRIADHPLAWEQAVAVGVVIADALEVAHRAGVLHRDIKPDNILVGEYGAPKLTDFGIARLVGGPYTTAGQIAASVAHAPPEVLDGHDPDQRSDVYSLCSTIYTLIAGRPPFFDTGDQSMLPLIKRIATQAVPALPPPTPAELNRIIAHGMAKSLDDRPPSAAALAAGLRHLAGPHAGSPGSTPNLDLAPPPGDRSGATAAGAPPDLAAPPGGHPQPLAVGRAPDPAPPGGHPYAADVGPAAGVGGPAESSSGADTVVAARSGSGAATGPAEGSADGRPGRWIGVAAAAVCAAVVLGILGWSALNGGDGSSDASTTTNPDSGEPTATPEPSSESPDTAPTSEPDPDPEATAEDPSITAADLATVVIGTDDLPGSVALEDRAVDRGDDPEHPIATYTLCGRVASTDGLGPGAIQVLTGDLLASDGFVVSTASAADTPDRAAAVIDEIVANAESCATYSQSGAPITVLGTTRSADGAVIDLSVEPALGSETALTIVLASTDAIVTTLEIEPTSPERDRLEALLAERAAALAAG